MRNFIAPPPCRFAVDRGSGHRDSSTWIRASSVRRSEPKPRRVRSDRHQDRVNPVPHLDLQLRIEHCRILGGRPLRFGEGTGKPARNNSLPTHHRSLRAPVPPGGTHGASDSPHIVPGHGRSRRRRPRTTGLPDPSHREWQQSFLTSIWTNKKAAVRAPRPEDLERNLPGTHRTIGSREGRHEECVLDHRRLL